VLDALLIIAGLAGLFAGGEALVRGASRLALATGLSPAVVGLTVVAAGTSMPELAVSVDAALKGSPDLALGNVVGSNIYNVLLILGVAAVIRACRLQGQTVRLEWPVMVGAALLLFGLAWDGSLGRGDGAVLAAGLVGFTVWLIRLARRASPSTLEQLDAEAVPTPGRWWVAMLQVIGGTLLLVAAGKSLITGATSIAAQAGVPERVVGLTLVAVGTSLPELATSAIASWRGNDDVAVGNVVGSNIFNVLGILGLTALVHPLDVGSTVLRVDLPLMVAVSLGFFLVIWPGWRIPRWKGAALLAAAAAYTAVLASTVTG